MWETMAIRLEKRLKFEENPINLEIEFGKCITWFTHTYFGTKNGSTFHTMKHFLIDVFQSLFIQFLLNATDKFLNEKLNFFR